MRKQRFRPLICRFSAGYQSIVDIKDKATGILFYTVHQINLIGGIHPGIR